MASGRTLRRRLEAALGAVLLLGATLGFLHGSAHAATEEVAVEKQAWYWESARRVNVPGTGLQLQPPNPHAPGHFPVSLEGGTSEKRVYLEWDLSALDPASISRFFITLQVSLTDDPAHVQEHANPEDAAGAADARPPQTLNASAAAIEACPVAPGEFVVDAEAAPSTITTVNEEGEPQEIRQEPEFDCEIARVAVTPTEDGAAWTADIAPIADLWASGNIPNNGIVLKAEEPEDASPTDNWQVEFHGARHDGISASMEFEPAAPAAPAPRFTGPDGQPTAVLGDRQASFRPQGGVSTETIPPQAGTAGGQRIIVGGAGSASEAGPGHLPWYVWLLLPVGATGLFLMSRALRPEWAEALQRKENRIARTLRARRLEAVPG